MELDDPREAWVYPGRGLRASLPIPSGTVQSPRPPLAYRGARVRHVPGVLREGPVRLGERGSGSGRETQVLMTATAKGLFLVLPWALLVLGCQGSRDVGPALIVLVVVDQLRGDLLDRYDSLFTHGIRRLLEEGYRFSNATHDHGHTCTSAGHATIATGVFPSRNGMVGDTWLGRSPNGWMSVYSVEDTLTHILGLPALPGRSPNNILREGLADWVVSADSSAIIFSASSRDRSAITLGGKTRGHVYWITENEGRFATSTYYRNGNPSWVDRFNRDEMGLIFGDSVWEQTMPVGARSLTRRDTVDYEGDGVHTYFPHRFHEESGNTARSWALNRWAFRQVYPDAAVEAFAEEAVRSMGLGMDDIPDLLALSFSQTDAVGHAYGPLSREQLENLLHLDRLLGDFMAFLDQTLGERTWVMAFTADHGVLTVPEYLVEEGVHVARATDGQLAALTGIFSGSRGEGGDPLEMADSLAEAVSRLPFVASALTLPELTSGPPADSFVVLMRNSFHPDRWIGGFGGEGSGVVFRFGEHFLPSASPRGTDHGSPYYYDRHVPLIFFGAGVVGGRSEDPVRTVDIAPTLASLAGIAVPTDLDGRLLLR